MPDVQVPWGSGELTVSVPEHWKVQQIAAPVLRPAAEHWLDRLGVAVNQPVAGLALGKLLAARRKGRIAIIVEDLTRQSPLEEILEVVLREIHHARIRDDQIEIVFATGMHPPMSAEDVRAKLGESAHGLSWRCNPWHDESAYVNVGRVGRLDVCIDRGVVQADLRIIISSVAPHWHAGFGGGYKMFLPGCAMLATARGLHRLGLRREPRQLIGTEPPANTMRAAIDAAGKMVDDLHGTTFAIEYLLDAANRPTFMAAGEPVPTHRMLTKQCAVACGVVPVGPADVLITNAHPRDYDLWQAFKCIPNTLWAARPGGVVICLARCEAGLHEMKTIPWPLGPKWTRRMIRLLGPEAICSMLDRIVSHVAGDSAWFIRLAAQMLQRNWIFMVSPKLVSLGVNFPGVALFATADEAIQAAQDVLGPAHQRVTVYSWGGTSYPVARG